MKNYFISEKKMIFCDKKIYTSDEGSVNMNVYCGDCSKIPYLILSLINFPSIGFVIRKRSTAVVKQWVILKPSPEMKIGTALLREKLSESISTDELSTQIP